MLSVKFYFRNINTNTVKEQKNQIQFDVIIVSQMVNKFLMQAYL